MVTGEIVHPGTEDRIVGFDRFIEVPGSRALWR
jgi:hypothetical protein